MHRLTTVHFEGGDHGCVVSLKEYAFVYRNHLSLLWVRREHVVYASFVVAADVGRSESPIS